MELAIEIHSSAPNSIYFLSKYHFLRKAEYFCLLI
jgi:hypothetical protein